MLSAPPPSPPLALSASPLPSQSLPHRPVSSNALLPSTSPLLRCVSPVPSLTAMSALPLSALSALKASSSLTPPATPCVLLASSVTLQMASASPAPSAVSNASVPPAQTASPVSPPTSTTSGNSPVLLTVRLPITSTPLPSLAKVSSFSD